MTELPTFEHNTETRSLETYFIKDDIKVIERFFEVPLDHSHPEGEKIQVFARNLIPRNKAKTKDDEEKLPYLLFLQGGPGFELGLQGSSGFAGEIHSEGYQTLWLDQRGTGLSTAISADMLASKSDDEKAAYLKHFRADSIVKDCELIRQTLLGHKEKPEDRKWTIMGQSFGGFCAINYLSFYSDGLKEVFLTGGLAPLVDSPDLVYEALIKKVVKRNQVYYHKYPQDVKRVRDIMSYLERNDVRLPNNGRLTPSRWQQLGIDFGMRGGIDRVHQLVFRASNDLVVFKSIAYKTLQIIQGKQDYDGNPLYAIMHESIYCQRKASNWSAQRVVNEHPQFLWQHVRCLADIVPVYFYGEMIFPDMFDNYSNLRPLKEAAMIIAKDESWGPLYDMDQLAKNEVKVTAATYMEDMYVDFGLAQDTAAKIGNVEQFITNQMFHDALRVDSKEVVKKLFVLSKREND
ncbi:alpha/beta-hydrolase [Stereum hirsutum FP-91666 SS1]|uniref:alpha/beta-hydrolase n=1 Tax=Stereum hirsutum (strain FP-91666) TaxID=721885 RepID=UPI000444A4B4|nr:alpha/beta-hydrolase [Stereum hirsutum FP-91666 SS1]EIM83989.1 alpha/beta-hydrolase [Stereum hirsutum FP-91666 SS1]